MELGKLWGLRRLADKQGRFMMLAVDQRTPMAQMIAVVRGVKIDQVSFKDMLDVKRSIATTLSSEATGVLIDPNYGVPAALSEIDVRTGLIITLEDHRVSESEEGRRSHLIDNWDVRSIRNIGADAVKLLVWYRPDTPVAVLQHQQALVESIGNECRLHDIPLILELLTYPLPKDLRNDGSRAEESYKKPELVIESVREFANPRFGVDLFKLESPVPTTMLPARDGTNKSRLAQEHFNEIGEICRRAGKPWVILSAGVTMQTFSRVLEYAYAAGASGFLAGRAIWQEAVREIVRSREVSAALELETYVNKREILLRRGERTIARSSPSKKRASFQDRMIINSSWS